MQELIYIISCVLFLHILKDNLLYKDYRHNIEDRLIHKHITTEALEALGATINFIDIWITLLDDNYDARRVS